MPPKTYFNKKYKPKRSKKTLKPRKRFAKKSFSYRKRTPSSFASKQMFVKLPVTYELTPAITTGSTQSYTFLGNSIAPYSSNYAGSSIIAGDKILTGLTQWNGFYDRVRVLGLSFKMQFINTSVTLPLRICIVPVPVTESDVATKITSMNALSMEDLSCLPRSWYYICGLAQGAHNIQYKKFTKTKDMLNIKDMADVESQDFEIPNSSGAGGTRVVNADESYIYYVRVANGSGSTTTPVIYFRLKAYCQLFNRNLVTSTVAT